MNTRNQFWALLKIQAAFKPWLFIFPLAFFGPYYFTIGHLLTHDVTLPLEMLLSNQNLFFLILIGVMLLDPEGMQTDASRSIVSSGTEFLLTRAVDRRLVLRARSVLFAMMVLVMPLLFFLMSLESPRLQVGEYNAASHQRILEAIPGSVSESQEVGRPGNITIQNGNPLIEDWRIWLFLTVGIITQAVIMLLFPLKNRRIIYWILYGGAIAIFLGLALYFKSLSYNETLFFAFLGHQPLFWLVTIAALLVTQVWCERRFTLAEH